MRRRALVVAALAAAVAGCAVGPSYRRPPVDVPAETRGEPGPPDAASLADLPWWEVFGDPVLQELVREALANNHDLKAAVARVEQARQLVGVARADLLPQIGYQGEAARGRFFVPGAPSNETLNAFLGSFNLAWEIDIWGRIRRATEAARAEYLGTEDFRRGVLLTLVSDVAQAYFELLSLDRELEIARLTTEAFDATVQLFEDRYEGDVGTLLEVSRGVAAQAQAAATIPAIEAEIVAKENQICVLLGRVPGDVVRGAALDDQSLAPSVPVGLPAQLLERRPDVRQSEQAMVAANANVGVAVGNFFPRLGLSTLYGGQSSEIENLVKGAGNVWAVAGTLAGPIFQGGRLLASYRAQKATWEESVQRFHQTTLNAFAEVSNAMVVEEKLKGVRSEKEIQVRALEKSVELSLERYNEGISTYYEVLEAQQQLFPAQLTLAQTIRNQLVAVVTLYRTLGGGWSLPVEQWDPATLPDPAAAPLDAPAPSPAETPAAP
ncbi:MAG: efflux transporter outer membrane subunit [bacterium]|nr:efflux transporter outer membrane subunit [bacterium]